MAITGNIKTQAAKKTTTPTKPNSYAQANWSAAPANPYAIIASASNNARQIKAMTTTIPNDSMASLNKLGLFSQPT